MRYTFFAKYSGLCKVLTLYTLTSVCIFSILFSIHFLRCWQGEIDPKQELLKLVFISFILFSFMFDSGVILWGEIRYYLLLWEKYASETNLFLFLPFKKYLFVSDCICFLFHDFLLTLSFSRSQSNSPYCLLYNLYDVSLENLVLDQLIIPSLICFFILTYYLCA